MKIILHDLKVLVDIPMQLYYDNKLVVSIAHSPVQHDGTKYIEIDRYFIKENLDISLLVTTHVLTRFQITNIFH